MELVRILRVLSERRRSVAVAFLLALGVAVSVTYRVSFGLPPSLHSQKSHTGQAEARVLIDTPSSQVGNLKPAGADALSARASLFADLLATAPVQAPVAQQAGIPVDQLVTLVPSTTGVVSPTPLALKATAAGSPAQPWRLAVITDPALPIISIDAQAPDARRAAKLANAAVNALREYVASVAVSQKIPAAQRPVVNSLGPAQAGDIVKRPRRLTAVVAAIFTFGFGCSAIVIASGFRRRWRQSTDPESAQPEYGGPDGDTWFDFDHTAAVDAPAGWFHDDPPAPVDNSRLETSDRAAERSGSEGAARS